jgi:hypothetical protein
MNLARTRLPNRGSGGIPRGAALRLLDIASLVLYREAFAKLAIASFTKASSFSNNFRKSPYT